MDLHAMIEAIETTSKENVWLLCEAELNALSRIKLRNLYFQALHELKESVDIENKEDDDGLS